MLAKQVRYLAAAGHRLTGLLVRCRLPRPTLAYVELHLTDRCESLCEFIKAKGVAVFPLRITKFFAYKNISGDTDPAEAFRSCRARFYCPSLREGKLYICSEPALGHYPARRFGVQMPSDGFADIYAPGITGRRILDVLNRPAEACRFCTVALRYFSWARSKGERSEWEDLRCGAPRVENGHDTDYA